MPNQRSRAVRLFLSRSITVQLLESSVSNLPSNTRADYVPNSVHNPPTRPHLVETLQPPVMSQSPCPSSSPPQPPGASSHSAGAGTSGGHTSGSGAHKPHHIEEFGEVKDGVVHVDNIHHAEETIPAPPISRKDKLARKERFRRLRGRLFAERHLMQYFYNETLYRSEGNRKVGPDELFLDLVIVGGIAALGHELRETFSNWRDVEKFILLFAALYMSWRTVIMLWNLWDLRSDLIDKAGIYLVFFSLTGIALGAHGAFQDGVRPYVAISAFAATFIPSATSIIWSSREPLLNNPQNYVNQIVLMSILNIIGVLPYFAAAFVRSERATRVLFWIPFIYQLVLTFLTSNLYRFLHRNRPGHTRLAIAIELMVEKYEVLTMIVLGESVLGLLFEGALLVTAENASVGKLYAGAAAGTAMLYALQTLYVNVDGDIVKGGVHAIRYKGTYGILWGNIHTLYHIALILFATGLGIAMRDIAIPPSAEAARWLMREAAVEAGTEGAVQFGSKQRWLLSAGWGTSIMLSGIIGAFHFGGPRAATKKYRLFSRFLIVTPIMLGMPFANISAGGFLAVYTVVLVVIAIVEYLCLQFDRMGFFTSEHTSYSGSYGLDDSNDDTSDEEDDNEVARAPEDALSKENQDAARHDILQRALQQRLRRRHCNRLVACNITSNRSTPKTRKRDDSAANEGDNV